MGRMIRTMMMVLLVGSVAAGGPAGAVVDHRGSVTGAGVWAGSTDPGIPGQPARFSIATSNEHTVAPDCPSVSTCPPLGRALLVREQLSILDITITCLSVHNTEAFFAGFAPEDEHVIPVAGLVIDGGDASVDALLALRTGVFFACEEDILRDDLRDAATPLTDGGAVVLDKCRHAVCPTD